ncbi:MAG: cell division protein FtsQ/DivIB, partial [Verrucomicrobiales bacterium]
MNLSRHYLLGRLVALIDRGRARLGNFQRGSRGRRRRVPAGRHVLDVVVKSNRQERLERARRWRRGLKWAAIIGALATLATSSHDAVARYFWQNPEMRLAHSAVVRTNGSLTHDEVLRRAGLTEDTHVYDVDLRAVRERLEAIPNVRHASVERELPGRLVISVEERLPVLWIECENPPLRAYTIDPNRGGLMIDEDAQLFRCEELRPEWLRLPVLNVRRLGHAQPGVQLTAAPVQTGLDLLHRLRETFGPRGVDVTEIDAPNDWSLVARLTNGMNVTFGYDAMDEQFDRLARVVAVADEGQVRLRTVNLLPRKNIPVTFLQPGENAPSPPAPLTLTTGH